MGRYSYNQPSSSSPSINKSYSCYIFNDTIGIPSFCYCGGDICVQTSKTEADFGQRFYTCKLQESDTSSLKAGRHLFKWCDEAMFEEIQSFQRAKLQQDERIEELTVGFDGERVDPPVIWARVTHHDHEIVELQQMVDCLHRNAEVIRRDSEKNKRRKIVIVLGTAVIVFFIPLILALTI